MVSALVGCGEQPAPEPPAPAPEAPVRPRLGVAPPAPPDLEQALLLALSVFPPGPDGKASKQPGDATLLILRREGGQWVHSTLEDRESNVFHKALPFQPPAGDPGLLTISGDAARLRLWRQEGGQWSKETLWAPTFGGKHDRLRDLELADLDGDGQDEIVLATHDQGVVAIVDVTPSRVGVRELDRQSDTFVHEVEVGDLNGDGRLEILATPSRPNRFNNEPQPGEILLYTLAGQRALFADLGKRHSKEVLIADLEGDGQPEVYAAVEGQMEGRVRVASVEIRRFPLTGGAGETLATLDDLLCRFLVPGDVDGDGRREMVAAAFRSGLWLLRPKPHGWERTLIDSDSSSFEHATALLDLDGDGRDEIYVAADDQGAVRRYVWEGEFFGREEIFHYPPELKGFTWNVTAAPVALTR
jgi:hypothetical protein